MKFLHFPLRRWLLSYTELSENLMMEKNAFNSPFDCSSSPLPPSYLQLPSPADSASTEWVLRTSAISFMCNCSHQLSLDDCGCNIMDLLIPSYSLLQLLPYRARKLVFIYHQFTQSPVKTVFTWHSRPFINRYKWISWSYLLPHLSTYLMLQNQVSTSCSLKRSHACTAHTWNTLLSLATY